MLMQETFHNTPIRRLVLKLGIPALAAQFFNVFYSIVDRIFLGHIDGTGTLALAAIGICAPILNVISCFTVLVGTGGAAIFSIYVGQNRLKEAQKALNNALFLFLMIGSAIILSLSILKKPLLVFLGCTPDIYELANPYFSIYILGTLFVFLGTGMNYFVLAQGDSRQGMIAVMIGAITNTILDPIFIFGFGWGVTGAALATITAQACTMLYVLSRFVVKKELMHPKFSKPNLHILRRIFTIGGFYFLVNVLDQFIMMLMNIILQRYSAPSETALYITCSTVVQSVMSIAYIPANGVTSGCGTLFSFFYGENNFKKLFSCFNYVLALCCCFMSALWIFTHTIPEVLIRVFVSDPKVIAMAIDAVKIYSTGLPLVAAQFAFVHGLTSMGKIKYAFPLSMIRKSIFVICLIIIPHWYSLKNIFWAGCIADVIGAIMCLTLFYLVITPKLRASMNG